MKKIAAVFIVALFVVLGSLHAQEMQKSDTNAMKPMKAKKDTAMIMEKSMKKSSMDHSKMMKSSMKDTTMMHSKKMKTNAHMKMMKPAMKDTTKTQNKMMEEKKEGVMK